MPSLKLRKERKEEKEKGETQKDKTEGSILFEKLFEEGVTLYHMQRAGGATFIEIGPNYKEVERYPLNPPWAYARILFNKENGTYLYAIDEVGLSPLERKIYGILMNIMIHELQPPPSGVEIMQYFREKAKEILRKYAIRMGRTPGVSWAKMMYYIERDVIGYGYIDPLMKDPFIEDISCDGV
ncbi:MAG: protein kinase, partial [Fervidicoccaceae archaeon]